MRDHRAVRQVLVTLFWLWLAVAVGIYGYRLYRRVTQGPKSERAAKAAADEGRAVGLGQRTSGRTTLPPLPDGPVEARLPPSLATQAPPAVASGVTPGVSAPEPGTPASLPDGPEPATPAPLPDRRAPARPTVAAALEGVTLPCELVPVVDEADEAITAGYRVLFTTRAGSVRAVAACLADELERLGYQVDDTTGEGDVRRLRARRDASGLEAEVRQGDDDASVIADVTT